MNSGTTNADPYDVVIVGGGASGLSAGLTLARARRRLLVVDAGEPRNGPAAHVHGLLSRDGAEPAEILTAGRVEVEQYGGRLVPARAVGLERTDGSFTVRLDDGHEVISRTVVVATGLTDQLPDVPGVAELWGTDVAHCPYCHGWEVRDSAIAVLGGPNRGFSVNQAGLIRQWSPDVVFFPDVIELTDDERERFAAREVRVVEDRVERLVIEDGRLTGVRTLTGETIERSAVFVGPLFRPRAELLAGLRCEVGANGWVVIDGVGRTSVAGCWAIGNVVNEPAQLAQAIGMGMSAAIAVNGHLVAADVERALARRAAAGTRSG